MYPFGNLGLTAVTFFTVLSLTQVMVDFLVDEASLKFSNSNLMSMRVTSATQGEFTTLSSRAIVEFISEALEGFDFFKMLRL